MTKRQSLAKKNAKAIRKMRKAVERKHFDVSTTSESAYDANIVELSNMIEGVTSSQRTGLKITPIRLEGRLAINWTLAQANEIVRVIIFQDFQNNGGGPSIVQLLESASTLSLYNNVNMENKKFKILYDRVFMNPQQYSPVPIVKEVKFSKKLNGTMHYLGSAALAADQGKGTIKLFAIGNLALSGTGNPLVDIESRLIYTDA